MALRDPQDKVAIAPPARSRAQVDARLLDNPILNALLTEHAELAQIEGKSRRYPPEIGPLAGVPDQSRQNYDDLRVLAEPGGVLGLFLPTEPALPQRWTLIRGGILTQMVCREPRFAEARALGDAATMRSLDSAEGEAMIALAILTEPGPFRERTMELGNFYGIFAGGRLVAMAGQRMRVPGFVEVSAVCTHPSARGRGYAGILMSEVMRDILAEGRTPLLHAFADNPAVSLYRRLGFEQRRTFHLAIIKNED